MNDDTADPPADDSLRKYLRARAEKQAAYRQTPEAKEVRRAYLARPEVKERNRAHKQRLDVKERYRAYERLESTKQRRIARAKTRLIAPATGLTNDELRDRLSDMRSAGKMWSEIAREFGVTLTAPRKWAALLDIDLSGPKARYSAAEIAAITDLFTRGKSIAEIAREIERPHWGTLAKVQEMIADGRLTARNPRKPPGQRKERQRGQIQPRYTSAEIARLRDLYNAGLRMADIAVTMQRPPSGIKNQLRKMLASGEIKRRQLITAAQRKIAERTVSAAARTAAIAAMHARISAGDDRDEIMRDARAAGARLDDIATAFGRTKQAIQQRLASRARDQSSVDPQIVAKIVMMRSEHKTWPEIAAALDIGVSTLGKLTARMKLPRIPGERAPGRRQSAYSEADIAYLAEAWANATPIAEIMARLGKSEGALRQKIMHLRREGRIESTDRFAVRKAQAQEKNAEVESSRAERRARNLQTIIDRIAAGEDRAAIFRDAHAAGISYHAIARHVGLSAPRIRQIVGAPDSEATSRTPALSRDTIALAKMLGDGDVARGIKAALEHTRNALEQSLRTLAADKTRTDQGEG